MNKLKWILISIVAVIFSVLCITVTVQSKQINSLQQDLSQSINNEKSLLLHNDSNKNEIRNLKFTIEQLDYFNDSIINVLNDTRKQLKIKDNDLKELQYLNTLAKKTDSIILHDTVFVENTNIDTIIGDQWYNLNLQLEYPNKIIATPQFISEKIIVAHLKKETIKPPKKCKLARLFQKKHKVVTVTIEENNPYIETKEYKHIEIVK